MNPIELMMHTVQDYIFKKKGVKIIIYLRDINDINKLRQAYEHVLTTRNNKNTNI